MPRLHHFTVVVPRGRTGEVVPFYAALGLDPMDKPISEGVQREGAWFVSHGVQVHISERDDSPVDAHRHFGLVLDDYDATIHRLRADGIRVEERPAVLGTRRSMAFDPLGNAVELLEDAGGMV